MTPPGKPTETVLDGNLQAVVVEVCQRMIEEVRRIGLDLLPLPSGDWAKYSEAHDPFDRKRTVTGRWEAEGEFWGSLQMREDGGIYGEFSVTRPHPEKRGAFIESVTVWGSPGSLRSELVLVPE